MTYSRENCPPRTDVGFRNFSDPEHHHAASPFLFLTPPINMISDFVLDSMHLLFLGAMKKLIDAWMSNDPKVKLTQVQREELSRRMKIIKRYQPSEFKRKIRPIVHHAKFKAVEFRFILLFIGPILFKGILEKQKYIHFLLLHAACRMLSGRNAIDFAVRAKELLNKFVSESDVLYGPQFVVMNIHCLKHISDDVINMESNLTAISAFPFENYLGKIKNMLHSPANVVAQIARRLHERRVCENQVPSLPSISIIKQNFENEIQILECINMTVTPKPPNNTILLKTGHICTINKIYLENNTIKLSVSILQKRDSVYTNPVNSHILNMWEISTSHPLTNKTITTNDIAHKAIQLQLNLSKSVNEKSFVIGLLH